MHTGAGLAGPGIAGLDTGRLRPLALALLASLALHVLALYALPILEESIRAPARPLSARLAKPLPPEQPATTEPAPAARPAPAPRDARPRPAVLPPLSEAKPVAPVQSLDVARPPAEPAGAERADAAPEPASAPAAASAPDPGSVARFRLELMEIARRYKRYPRVAQDNNWEGRVELRIAFAENGSIASLAVKKGAGRTVLDEAAQAMIRSAQAQAAIPPALRGKAFTLDIAVDFFLRDEK